MNWLQLLLKLAPYVVVGAEQLHADLNGAGKKQAAQDALTIATAAALEADPSDAALTQTASQLTGLVIDATVANLKQTGVLPTTGAAASTPAQASLPAAPAPQPEVIPSPGLDKVVPA